MRKWIPSLLIVVAVIASIVAYPDMPERVPTHWNMAGEVDGWSGRFAGAWMMPLIMGIVLVILRVVPLIDPRRANYEGFRGVYEVLIITILAFLLLVHLLLLALATGHNVPITRVIPAAVGALFIGIGVFLPRAKSNWFVGIRTPWTMTSELSWERTHTLGGTLFMLSGAAGVVAALAAPRAAMWVLIGCMAATVISLLVYSFIVWKGDREGRRTQ